VFTTDITWAARRSSPNCNRCGQCSSRNRSGSGSTAYGPGSCRSIARTAGAYPGYVRHESRPYSTCRNQNNCQSTTANGTTSSGAA
jgi:hypothetical protein